MLTAKQESYFETFGFLVMRRYFSPDKMKTITRQFDSVLTKDRSGVPFNREEQLVTTIVEQSQFFTQLVDCFSPSWLICFAQLVDLLLGV